MFLARRAFSTSRCFRATAEPVIVVAQPVAAPPPPPPPPAPAPRPVIKAKRPIGGFRGGLVGFLLGLTAAGSYGYLKLFDEYQAASNLLIVSVEELKSSTKTLSTHLRRIEEAEKDIESIKSKVTTQEELEKLRSELKKVTNGQHIDLLNLKSHMMGIESDLHALGKKEGSSIRA